MDRLIEILKYLFLGAIQGITEVLPISSSGHLIILGEVFHIKQDNNLTFEILLHFGSLIAIIYFYRKTLKDLIKNFFLYLFNKRQDAITKTDFNYVLLLALATIPIGIVGYFFNDFITKYFTSLLTVGFALIVTAIILYIISKMPKGNKEKEDVTWKDALFVGIIQACAIIPGISRSGSTVSASLTRKFNLDNALRFSFLLFIPASLGAMLLDIIKLIKNPLAANLIIPYFIAFLTAIIFTYISLNIFINVIKKGKLSYFSIYCLIVGTTSLILNFIL